MIDLRNDGATGTTSLGLVAADPAMQRLTANCISGHTMHATLAGNGPRDRLPPAKRVHVGACGGGIDVQVI